MGQRLNDIEQHFLTELKRFYGSKSRNDVANMFSVQDEGPSRRSPHAEEGSESEVDIAGAGPEGGEVTTVIRCHRMSLYHCHQMSSLSSHDNITDTPD